MAVYRQIFRFATCIGAVVSLIALVSCDTMQWRNGRATVDRGPPGYSLKVGSPVVYSTEVGINPEQWRNLISNKAGYIIRIMTVNEGPGNLILRIKSIGQGSPQIVDVNSDSPIQPGSMYYLSLDAPYTLEAKSRSGACKVRLDIEKGIEKNLPTDQN